MTSLKYPAFVAYPRHVELLNFRKEYKERIIRSDQSLIAFFLVETEVSKGTGKADNGSPDSGYGYFTSKVLQARESIQITSGT